MAGEGARSIAQANDLFLDREERTASDHIRMGSALIALQTKPVFDQYHLNERSRSKAKRLKQQAKELGANLEVSSIDANAFIQKTIGALKSRDRGIILLDPWGLQIEWASVELIAKTEHLDMWYLFPTQAIVRMLPRGKMAPEDWARKLDSILGDKNWLSEFYKTTSGRDLFSVDRSNVDRDVTFDSVERYVVGRLRSTFRGSCVDVPLRIGRRGNPIFSFCFASGNPSEGAKRLTTTLANAVIRSNRED